MAADVRSGALLTDRTDVLRFWRDDVGRADEPTDVRFLDGGVSSQVVLVVTERGEYVIKQALPQLRVEAPWFSRPERSTTEVRCAIVLADLVPGAVPEVVATVPSSNAFVMRSAPHGSEPWKSRLMRGDASPTIGRAVGALLGRIHVASAARPELADAFADRSFFDELRIDPYLRYVAARDPASAPALGQVVDGLLAPGRCLTHGDFSPKNLLVDPDDRVLLVDHEVAHWGHPAFDVGFVTSHLCLKAVHFRTRADDYLRVADDLLDGYADQAGREAGGLGSFAAQVTGALLIARVDGKSPVEYLTDDGERAVARTLGQRALLDPPADPWALVAEVRSVLAGA